MSDYSDDLGDSRIDTGFPLPTKNGKPPEGKVLAIRPEVMERYQTAVRDVQTTCLTKRDFQEKKTDVLGECVFIAAEIYKDQPIPDFAYQLAALTNAHNSALSQLERMKDPQQELEDIEAMVKRMFEDLVKVLMQEIEKSKRDLVTRFPSERLTVDEHFGRMAKAISPESNKLYAGMVKDLKKILGIK